MAELPILPIKTDALLADTVYMSADQFGCYVRLLLAMWRNAGGQQMPYVRDDERELARICGVSLRLWRTLSDAVVRPCARAEGIITQKRLTATWLDVQELRRKRAAAAAARWAGHGDAHAYALHEPSTANQNQISKEESSFLVGREMTAEEFMTMKQRRAPLPVSVKQRGNR